MNKITSLKEVLEIKNKIEFSKKGIDFTIEAEKVDYVLKVKWTVKGESIEGNEDSGFGMLNERKKSINIDCGFKLKGNDRKFTGIGLEEDQFLRLVEIKENITKEKEEEAKKIIENLIKGKIKLKFSVVGCDYKYYNYSTESIKTKSNMNYSEKDCLIEKAVKRMLGENIIDLEFVRNLDIIKSKKLGNSFEITLEKLLKEKLQEKQKKEENLDKLKQKAKETGKKQFVKSYSTSCNSRYEECDIDTINVYIDKNGKETKERIHNY